MYEVYLERPAERDLRRLSAEVFSRVLAAVHGLAQEPRPRGARKLTGAREDWRLRVGDHRVVYEIEYDARLVRVLRVRHRREAYR